MPVVSAERRAHAAEDGSPPSPFFLIVHRIADRLGPEFERAFMEHAERLRDRIDEGALLRALGVRHTGDVLQALGVSTADPRFHRAVRDAIDRTMLTTGTAVASATAAQIGIAPFEFDGARPRFALIAQRHAARLISRVDEETKAAVRDIIARSFLDGLTIDDQARLIRDIVGLRKGHANAVANLRDQLQAAARLGPGAERDRLERLITRRRLDAVTKQRLRSAIRSGTVTPDLIDQAADTYAASLRNRRAKDIARTEGQHAANAGQHQAWTQAADDGLIDRKRARRMPIITPDERLRPLHAVIPGMNPGGVRLDEPFETPGGPAMHPPWPFDPYNCRCGVGLVFVAAGADSAGGSTSAPASLPRRADGTVDLTRIATVRELGLRVQAELQGTRPHEVTFRFRDEIPEHRGARGIYRMDEDNIGYDAAIVDGLERTLQGARDRDAWDSFATMLHEINHSRSGALAPVRLGHRGGISMGEMWFEEAVVETLARRDATRLMFGGDLPFGFNRSYQRPVDALALATRGGLDPEDFLFADTPERIAMLRNSAETVIRDAMQRTGFSAELIEEVSGRVTIGTGLLMFGHDIAAEMFRVAHDERRVREVLKILRLL